MLTAVWGRGITVHPMTWISVTVLLAASICFNGWRILEERETQAACEGTTLTPHIAAGPRSLRMVRKEGLDGDE